MKNKRILRIILPLVIAILMGALTVWVSGTAPVATAAEENIDVAIKGFTLSFEDSIYIKYRVAVDGVDVTEAENFGMRFWDKAQPNGYGKENSTHSASVLGYQVDGGKVYYTFKYDKVYAKNMTDDVYAQAYVVFDGKEYCSSVEKYSILQYAYNTLGKTKDTTPTLETRELLEGMLSYGSAAQRYFKYNTERAADANFYQISTKNGALIANDLSQKGLYLKGESVTLMAPEFDGELTLVGWTVTGKDGIASPLSGGTQIVVNVPEENVIYTPVYALDLTEDKTAAKAELESYVSEDEYRDAQKAELVVAIENGKAAIDSAQSREEISSALVSAKESIDAIETDEEITAKEPTITTPFDAETVFTSTRATLDVYAKDASGNKLSMSKVTVTVNGVNASVNWDDSVKTSYNFVFVEGENTVVITATDGKYTKVKTYTVICDLTKPTTVTVSIEAFSVRIGYLVAPVDFELNNENLSAMAMHYGYDSVDAFKEKLSMAHVLDYVLYINGYTMSYQGSLESTYNGFYMSSVSGVDTSYIEVPEALAEALEMNGYFVDPCVLEDGTLCEFDVTWGAGWMYTVNNSFPNVPFCDYVPQDGDVMRVQFTLAFGSDLGDWGMMGEPFFEVVDRDPLTKLIAEAIDLGIDTEEAIAVVSTFGITQDELDAACVALQAAINAAQ